MTHNIKTARGRATLHPRGNPYFDTIAPGVQLGLYVGKLGTSWKGRVSNLDKSGPRWKGQSLGPVEPDQDGLTYAEAMAACLSWAEVERGRAQKAAASQGEVTVADACAYWLDHKQLHHGKRTSEKTRSGWVGRAKALTSFFGGGTPLRDITAARAIAFANRPKDRSAPTQDPRRSAEGFSREMAALKAILSRGAKQSGYDGPRGWDDAEKIKPGEIAHRKADLGDDLKGLALSIDQVRALIAASDDPAFATFVQAMFLTCQRVQSLRMADVRDFDAASGRLTLRFGKNATKRNKGGVLQIPLFEDAIELFQRLAAGRLPGDPLIPAADGGRLPEDFQRYPMARAAKAAGLPADASIYAVRRGAITHAAAVARVDIMTISEMADVDPSIIRKHYFNRTERLGRFADLESAKIRKLRVV